MTLLTCAACGGNLDGVPVKHATDHFICDRCIEAGNVPAIPLSALALRCPSCHVRELPQYREPARDRNGRAWCDDCAENAVKARDVVARIKSNVAEALRHRAAP